MHEYLKDLSPMVHYVGDECKYDVPVWNKKSKYDIYLNNHVVRKFSEKTLPDYIKAKLTMAMVHTEFYKPDNKIFQIDLFVRPKDSGMEHTAWRVSESMYIVVLTEDEIANLEGK